MTRALQKLVHVGCRELGIDAETRRDLQLVVTGKASMADMTEPELEAVVEQLKRRGFEPVRRRGFRPGATRADLRYVHVLWRLLNEAGVMHRAGREGLNAFVRLQFSSKWKSAPIDIDALRDHGKIDDVIQALKAICRRHGIPTERSSGERPDP